MRLDIFAHCSVIFLIFSAACKQIKEVLLSTWEAGQLRKSEPAGSGLIITVVDLLQFGFTILPYTWLTWAIGYCMIDSFLSLGFKDCRRLYGFHFVLENFILGSECSKVEIFRVRFCRISIPEFGTISVMGWISHSVTNWFCALGLVGFQSLNWLEAGCVS